MAEYGKPDQPAPKKELSTPSPQVRSASTIADEEKKRAIDWAKSMGYPIPEEPLDGCSSILLVLGGFLICFIPGIFAFLYINNRQTKYNSEMTAIRTKWVDAGKPEPGIKGRIVEPLERLPDSKAQKTTQEQLEEIKELKEKNLIEDEEYQRLRTKILGL
jgi:hypothetical protein